MTTTNNTTARYNLHDIMTTAWQFVKRYGMSLSEGLKKAWVNAKLKVAMSDHVVKFYYNKVDGSIREAYGTLKASLLPQTKGTGRKPSPSVQVYFDTEKQEYRCFKKANLLRMA